MNMLTPILIMVAMHVRAFMNGTCETVVIVTDAGPVVINKSDYDRNPDQFTLHDAAAVDPNALRNDGPTIAEFIAAGYPASNYPPKGYASKSTVEEIAAAVADEAANQPQPATPAPAVAPLAEVAKEAGATAPSFLVMKDGKKHFVVDATGAKAEAEGIDSKGYANEQDAWNAILALPRG